MNVRELKKIDGRTDIITAHRVFLREILDVGSKNINARGEALKKRF